MNAAPSGLWMVSKLLVESVLINYWSALDLILQKWKACSLRLQLSHEDKCRTVVN